MPRSRNVAYWIQGAIKKPGALRSLARREKALTANGTIRVSWLKQKARGKGKVAKRARLALALRSLRRR